jgi:putative acetyltransferase
MQIHPMTEEDIPRALALWRSSDGVGMSDSDTPEELTAFLVRNPGLSLVAVSGRELAGAVLVGHDGRRGFLYHLAVRADAQRQGVARQLVEHALAGLSAAGILKCHIMVLGTNQQGGRFWSHMGWTLRDDLQILSKSPG